MINSEDAAVEPRSFRPAPESEFLLHLKLAVWKRDERVVRRLAVEHALAAAIYRVIAVAGICRKVLCLNGTSAAAMVSLGRIIFDLSLLETSPVD